MEMKCDFVVTADNFDALKEAINNDLSKCVLDALPETEGGSVSLNGTTDNRGNSSVSVTGTVNF